MAFVEEDDSCTICCVEIPLQDLVTCRFCHHRYHWTCLYRAYQTKNKDILNGRCPYCTCSLPIVMRIHLSNRDINAWLMTAIENEDSKYAFTGRRSLAALLCDSDTRRSFTAWKFEKPSCVNVELDTFNFYATMWEENRYPLFTAATRLIIECDNRLLAAFYKTFGRNVPEAMTNEQCRSLMREYLELALMKITSDEETIHSIDNDECPKCHNALISGFCKNCLRTYRIQTIQFEDMERTATIAKRIDSTLEELQGARSLEELCFDLDLLTTNESNALIDGMVRFVDKRSDEVCTTLNANELSKKLTSAVHELSKLLKEALVPLIFSALELTAQAAIFVPLERKRAIARHAYLRSAYVHLALATIYDAYKAMHAENKTTLEHFVNDAIYTLEDVEEELRLVDELIIENSLETIIAKHQK